MRIDKYLKVSRRIKRRSIANEAWDSGRITVNGRPGKRVEIFRKLEYDIEKLQ